MSPFSPGPLAASPRCWPAGETAQPAREPHTKLCTSANSLEGPRHIRSSNGPLSSRPLALRAPRACGWSVSTLALSPVAAESRRGRRRAPVRGNQAEPRGGRRSHGAPDPGARGTPLSARISVPFRHAVLRRANRPPDTRPWRRPCAVEVAGPVRPTTK